MNDLLRGSNLINILLVTLGFVVTFFAIIIFLFIPGGKEYKRIHQVYAQEMIRLDEVQRRHDETMEKLQLMQEKNRNYILAFENSFNPEAFDALYSKYFMKLTLTKARQLESEDIFTVYEVNTSSNINSPNDFYEFINAVNNSENIIRIEFPINFVAKNGMVDASFRMKVYGANFANYHPKAGNTTAEVSENPASATPVQ